MKGSSRIEKLAHLCKLSKYKFSIRRNRHRLATFIRLDACDIRYSDAFGDVIVNMSLETDYPREVELELDYPYAQIHYTTDGSIPTAASPIVPASITVNKGDVIRAQGFTSNGRPVGKLMTRKFENFEE